MSGSNSQRNVQVIRSLYERYFSAWEQHAIPKLPRGLLVWAPGASIDNSGKHVFEVDAHDWADEPQFIQVEASYFWQAIPDFRITDLNVCGEGDVVLSICKYEGTAVGGESLPVAWTADRWRFDAQGRLLHWQQVTDLETWKVWQAAVPHDYVAYVNKAFTDAGVPPRHYP